LDKTTNFQYAFTKIAKTDKIKKSHFYILVQQIVHVKLN